MYRRRQDREAYDDRRGYREDYGPYRDRGAQSNFYTDYTYTYTYDDGYGPSDGYYDDGYYDDGYYDSRYYDDDRGAYPARDYWTRSGNKGYKERDPYDPNGGAYPSRRPGGDYEMRHRGASGDPRRQDRYRPRALAPGAGEGGVVDRRVQAAPFRPPPDYSPPNANNVYFKHFQDNLVRAFKEVISQINPQENAPRRQETTYVIAPAKEASGYVASNQPRVISLPLDQPSLVAKTASHAPSHMPSHAPSHAPSHMASHAPSRPASAAHSAGSTGRHVIIPPPPGTPGYEQITNAIPKLHITSTVPTIPTDQPAQPREVITPGPQVRSGRPGGADYQVAVDKAQFEFNKAYQSGMKTPEELVQVASETFAREYLPLKNQDPRAFTQVVQQQVAHYSRPATSASRSRYGGAGSSASVTVPMATQADLNKIYVATFDQPRGGM